MDPSSDAERHGGIARRQLVRTLGAATVAAGALSTAATADGGGQPLEVIVHCGPDGGRVVVENTGSSGVEVRDIDGAGVDALDGRPHLAPGRALVLDDVPDGTAVLQAFDPEVGTPVAPRVEAEVACAACTLPTCLHPVIGFSDLDDEAESLGVDPALEVRMPILEPSLRPGEPEPNLDFLFEPMGFRVAPGDVVSFLFSTPEHTVTAYHPAQGRQRRIPEGLPPFSSPVLSAGRRWLYRFDEPGVYDLFCAPHEAFGMVVRVVVAEEGTVPSTDFSKTGRPPAGFAGVVLDDPALAPEHIVENGPIAWQDLAVIDSGEGGEASGGSETT
jgi:plastocyanin